MFYGTVIHHVGMHRNIHVRRYTMYPHKDVYIASSMYRFIRISRGNRVCIYMNLLQVGLLYLICFMTCQVNWSIIIELVAQ